MALNAAEVREFLRIAVEALGRYKLRTALSILGVVLGVAAVIAMMSVSEGAAREALAQVEALGLDNLVAQTRGFGAGVGPGLVAGDADRAAELVPFVRASSPLVARYVRVGRAAQSSTAKVLGVRASFESILRLAIGNGRFLSVTDEQRGARVCVLGASIARQLFGYREPVGDFIRVGPDDYAVVGVLRDADTSGGDGGGRTGSTLAWHDITRAVFVPYGTLSGRSLETAPGQPADEIWLQLTDGARTEEMSRVFERVLARRHPAAAFQIVVPRELLAQRQRTQRTFSIVVGSVAALALLVGGIGIMNIMLTSVIERTREIGVRRTVGATRRDVTSQFLVETLLMTLSGGALGIVVGVAVSWAITAFAGWTTNISIAAVLLAFSVSFCVGLVFGLYPAIKAGNLEPVDAMRYE